jgi:hypothetical protein
VAGARKPPPPPAARGPPTRPRLLTPDKPPSRKRRGHPSSPNAVRAHVSDGHPWLGGGWRAAGHGPAGAFALALYSPYRDGFLRGAERPPVAVARRDRRETRHIGTRIHDRGASPVAVRGTWSSRAHDGNLR